MILVFSRVLISRFLILATSGVMLFGFCMAFSTERLSVHMTCFPRILEAALAASRIAKASEVKMEENCGRVPVFMIDPFSSTTAKEVLAEVLDPSVKINFHPDDLKSEEMLANKVRYTVELVLVLLCSAKSITMLSGVIDHGGKVGVKLQSRTLGNCMTSDVCRMLSIAEAIRFGDLRVVERRISLSITEFVENRSFAYSVDITAYLLSSMVGRPASTRMFLIGVVRNALMLLLAA